MLHRVFQAPVRPKGLCLLLWFQLLKTALNPRNRQSVKVKVLIQWLQYTMNNFWKIVSYLL